MKILGKIVDTAIEIILMIALVGSIVAIISGLYFGIRFLLNI